MDASKDFLGKKIVFVHPPDLVKSELIEILTNKEFEVYTLINEQKIPEIHARYPDSIFFLNIDASLSEAEWQKYIEKLNSLCPGIQMGILSFNISAQEQVQYYLIDLGISCGFIQLKQGVSAASDMMLKVLKANEVKGRRKYLRYHCSEDEKTVVNLELNDARISGSVLDISSVGMSCSLEVGADIVKNQLLRNVQLRLRGVLVNTDMISMGSRDVPGQPKQYVFLFAAGSQDKMKSKIRSYIYSSLQKKFDREFS